MDADMNKLDLDSLIKLGALKAQDLERYKVTLSVFEDLFQILGKGMKKLQEEMGD